MAERQYDWAAIAKNPKFIELHHKNRHFSSAGGYSPLPTTSCSLSEQHMRQVFSRSK